MTAPLKNSIKRKVMLVIMLASATVLLVTVAAFMVYDVVTFRQNLARNLVVQAKMVGENCNAALIFKNDNDATAILASLRNDPDIIAAALYDEKGKLFAKYPPLIADTNLPAGPQGREYRFSNSHLIVFQPVNQAGALLGTVYVQSDLTALSQREQLYGAISLFIITGSLLIALWLSSTLQKRISNPIVALADTARAISGKQDFSLRAAKTSDDELGDLTDAFNLMLEKIQSSHSALAESESQLAAIFNQAGAGIAQCDLTGRFLKVNDRYCEITGHARESLVNNVTVQDITHPDDRALNSLALDEVNTGRPSPILEKRYVQPDGKVVWARVSVVPLRDANGKVEFAVSVAQDITERKRQEVELAGLVRQKDAQARLFDATLSSIKDLAYTFDLEGNWIYANKALLQIWGKSLKEITGKSSLELGYPPELALRLKEQVKEVVATRQPVSGETYFTDAAGVEDYHEYIFSPVLAADGTVTAVCGTTRLTTERKRTEGMLRQNEALFSALVDQAPNGVYVVDAQFRLQQINARAMPAFAKVEPKIGRDFGEVMEILWGPEVGAQLAGIFRHTLATGEPYRSPRFAEFRQDLNEDRAYEWETQRITLPGGTHGVVCYFNDITDAERNKANLAFLATINDDLLRLDTADDILNTVCAKICEYLHVAIGCFVEINEAADTSKVTHEWRRPETPCLLGTYKLSDYLSADFQKTLRTGECFIVRDTAADPRLDAEKYEALKIRSFICAPLMAEGRWRFLFDIHDSKPRDWREDQIRLMRELVARLWARLERVHAESLLRQNEALFAALIEQAPVGVYVINAQFRVQQINTRALPAFEKVEPKTGRTLTEVMHIQWGKEAGDELAAIFRHTLDTGEPYISPEYSNIRADIGVEKTYEWQTRRVTLPDGSHGVVCYFNDITERIRSEQALVQAKTAAEAANRSKDDFLAALSHELRTPLNPVLLLASAAAEDAALPAEIRAQFATIRNNVELEARLIDDLLDLTRITREKLSLEMHPLDVHEILRSTIDIVRADADKKQISLTLRLESNLAMILGDEVRLQQIFWNVLKNAVKFTPAGGSITIETQTHPDSGNISIRVIDTGIGLTAGEIENIFDAFSQGDHAANSSTHRFGGLGLGLTISRKLVELHSGVIRAMSAGRDQGATFTLEFPPVKGDEKKSARQTAEQPPVNGLPARTEKKRSLRILLVEDHEATRVALAHLLARREHAVRAAASVVEARALAQKNKFDLVVSDIGLPDGDGYALMAELRNHFGLTGIALTGYGMEQDVAKAKAAGFVSHLTKPVRVESLEKALAEIDDGQCSPG